MRSKSAYSGVLSVGIANQTSPIALVTNLYSLYKIRYTKYVIHTYKMQWGFHLSEIFRIDFGIPVVETHLI